MVTAAGTAYPVTRGREQSFAPGGVRAVRVDRSHLAPRGSYDASSPARTHRRPGPATISCHPRRIPTRPAFDHLPVRPTCHPRTTLGRVPGGTRTRVNSVELLSQLSYRNAQGDRNRQAPSPQAWSGRGRARQPGRSPCHVPSPGLEPGPDQSSDRVGARRACASVHTPRAERPVCVRHGTTPYPSRRHSYARRITRAPARLERAAHHIRFPGRRRGCGAGLHLLAGADSPLHSSTSTYEESPQRAGSVPSVAAPGWMALAAVTVRRGLPPRIVHGRDLHPDLPNLVGGSA